MLVILYYVTQTRLSTHVGPYTIYIKSVQPIILELDQVSTREPVDTTMEPGLSQAGCRFCCPTNSVKTLNEAYAVHPT